MRKLYNNPVNRYICQLSLNDYFSQMEQFCQANAIPNICDLFQLEQVNKTEKVLKNEKVEREGHYSDFTTPNSADKITEGQTEEQRMEFATPTPLNKKQKEEDK